MGVLLAPFRTLEEQCTDFQEQRRNACVHSAGTACIPLGTAEITRGTALTSHRQCHGTLSCTPSPLIAEWRPLNTRQGEVSNSQSPGAVLWGPFSCTLEGVGGAGAQGGGISSSQHSHPTVLQTYPGRRHDLAQERETEAHGDVSQPIRHPRDPDAHRAALHRENLREQLGAGGLGTDHKPPVIIINWLATASLAGAPLGRYLSREMASAIVKNVPCGRACHFVLQ